MTEETKPDVELLAIEREIDRLMAAEAEIAAAIDPLEESSIR